jgi:DNA-binding NarL/FixJ family response regulator
MRVRNADAQYALLMHLHKMAGTVQRPPAARRYHRVTAEERVRAVSMFSQGHTITEISKELGCSKTRISNMVSDTPLRKHDRLSRDEINRIHTLSRCGANLSQIARELRRQVSTIKYQVDKIKSNKKPLPPMASTSA